jgi:hypothetical protein
MLLVTKEIDQSAQSATTTMSSFRRTYQIYSWDAPEVRIAIPLSADGSFRFIGIELSGTKLMLIAVSRGTERA